VLYNSETALAAQFFTGKMISKLEWNSVGQDEERNMIWGPGACDTVLKLEPKPMKLNLTYQQALKDSCI
jgi:hypothetical protein